MALAKIKTYYRAIKQIHGKILKIKKQVEKDVREMEDKSIIDQNGKPAPGVDLRDYPGLDL